MYTQDYDEMLPGNQTTAPNSVQGDAGLATVSAIGFLDTDPTKVGRNWGRDIQPYIKNLQIYICPNSVPRSSYSAGSAYAETTDPRGSNMSYLLNGITADKPLAALTAPANLIFLCEYAYKSRVSQVRPCPVSAAAPTTFYQFNHVFYDYMHSQGGNLVFCDGHAKWRRKTQIKFAEFGADMTGQANPDRTFQDPDNGCNTTTCPDNSVQLKAAF